MTRRLRLALLYSLCAPWDLSVLLLSALVAPAWGCGYVARQGVIWLRGRPEGWLQRAWPYSTTVGHLVLLHPAHGRRAERHELVHVRQYEAAVCGVWLLAGAGAAAAGLWGVGWRAAGLTAALAPWVGYFGGSLASWLRGQRAYLDNPFERHARAEAEEDGAL